MLDDGGGGQIGGREELDTSPPLYTFQNNHPNTNKYETSRVFHGTWLSPHARNIHSFLINILNVPPHPHTHI